MNEIRNELLLILDYVKADNQTDKDFKLHWLLERFEYDIKEKIKDKKYELEMLEGNLKTLEYVKEELKGGK